jgi:hypothetical protein
MRSAIHTVLVTLHNIKYLFSFFFLIKKRDLHESSCIVICEFIALIKIILHKLLSYCLVNFRFFEWIYTSLQDHDDPRPTQSSFLDELEFYVRFDFITCSTLYSWWLIHASLIPKPQTLKWVLFNIIHIKFKLRSIL